MVNLKITDKEVRSGEISGFHLESAVRALRDDGIVILEDIVDTSHLDILHERMLRDLEEILARPDAPFNFTKSNVQQDPPPFPPYLFRDILVNDIVISVTKAILGDGMKNTFYSGNTALPSKSRQPVHTDTGQLWPNLTVATPPYQLVVNIPVVDMDDSNGSTEIWPGTHLDTTVVIQDEDIKLPQDALERRRAISPPLQPCVRRGSVVIRDIRLWHAGMPNHTQSPRPMIALIHTISWWSDGRIVFAKGSEEFLEHPDLQTTAVFVDAPIDHTRHNEAYDIDEQG